MTLPEQFAEAQERIKALTRRPSNEELLELYALYKQGTAGDATGSRPGMFDLKNRAKFDAWTAKKGWSADRAMTAYVELAKKLVAS